MKIVTIKGENKGKTMLYALSTCVWCKKTKQLLDKLGVEYSIIYMDYLDGKEKDDTMKILKKWNPRRSFPTLVINDNKCIVGFKEDKIKEAFNR
jgi:glutaredoxin